MQSNLIGLKCPTRLEQAVFITFCSFPSDESSTLINRTTYLMMSSTVHANDVSTPLKIRRSGS
jgi:hypothetical protein